MSSLTIGICDWGIGGLGFYNLLRAERPDFDVVYLGDQGATSYGRIPRHQLALRIDEVLRWFARRGVGQVVVACNAASTVLPEVRVPGVNAMGVIAPTLAKLRSESTSIGVIGGVRTIRSGAYSRPLRKAGICVAQRIAQPLSRLIEDGLANDASTQSLLHEILNPLRDCQRLVLACTHYVVLTDDVQRFMPNAEVIDPAMEVWKQIRSTLPPPRATHGSTQFFTTGNPEAMERHSRSAFGVQASVEQWS